MSSSHSDGPLREASPDTYTAAEVDAAVAALGDPARLSHAEQIVTHAAPALQRILTTALHEGGWFGSAHASCIAQAAAEADPLERSRAVDTLVAEQTQLGMFVGVALGFQLAHELRRLRAEDASRVGGDAETSAQPPTAITTTET